MTFVRNVCAQRLHPLFIIGLIFYYHDVLFGISTVPAGNDTKIIIILDCLKKNVRLDKK